MPALHSVRSAFLLLWRKREIEEVFKRLDWYRAELNLRTVAVINVKADNLLHNMNLLRSQNESLVQQADRQGNDIVEVVSINKSMLSTIESLAAILTRRNGETFTVSCETGIPSSIYKEPDVSSIKYVLEEKDEQAAVGNLIKGNGSAFVMRILNALHFREEDDRQETVAEAHQRTFQWIFDIHSIDDSFSDLAEWLKVGHGCYWINGKAGSGKSTLMKYIYQQQRTYQLLAQWSKSHRSKRLNLIIASFFFWNNGSELQKSYEGMFRSLLVQIMSRRPDLVPVLFPALSRHLLSKPSPNLHISLTELKAAFSKLTKVMDENTKLFILIDGVDEFAGDHLEISKLLLNVTKTKDIKILLSSRPIPACFQVFSQCPTLQVQDLTEGDILNYIEDELISNELMQEKEMLERGFSDFILSSLIEKAAGVFLWIVLVANDLLTGLANYDSKEDLMKRIDRLPSDLEKLYDHLFTSLDIQYRAEASLLFQLVMRSVQVQKAHLTVLQLQFAEASSPERLIPDAMFSFPPGMEAVMIKSMEGRLRSRCRGLLESQQKRMSHQRDPWVTFLHRTVQEYFNNHLVWEKVIALNPKSLNELDELLIASCIRDMKQRHPKGDDIENWRAVLDFESCLEYSSKVAQRGGTFHEAYCELALTILIQYCHEIDPTIKLRPTTATFWRDGLVTDFQRMTASAELHNPNC
jgi:NACHT domain